MNELRFRIYEQIINQTPGSRTSLFNKVCGITILISIFCAVIVTENSIDYQFGDQIDFLDWIIGGLFCVEYLCRLWVAPLEEKYGKGWSGIIRYVASPMAIIDVIAIIPSFIDVRVELKILRIIRLLRILKIGRSEKFKESIFHFNYALRSKSQELQISTFYTVLLLLVSSTLMYLAESSIQPELLGSIPRCLWWSITTVSAVGYGDSIPVTAFGKIIASITSLFGIAAIAIPTGILASGFSESIGIKDKTRNELNEITD
mgnify:CR=1 FL=1|tara:strand:- start:27 stop:806 length:780 start_codon:yes stop_codon:yes gene_type:complete